MKHLNIRSKNLKIRNLPKGHKRLSQINSKPYLFLCLFLILGILLFIIKNYILSVLFLVLFIYNFCFVKNEVLAEFYDDYVIFYQIGKHKDECYLLFWDDVDTWKYVRTKKDYDELQLTLKDHKKVAIPCIGKHKTLRYFKRYIQNGRNKIVASSKIL